MKERKQWETGEDQLQGKDHLGIFDREKKPVLALSFQMRPILSLSFLAEGRKNRGGNGHLCTFCFFFSEVMFSWRETFVVVSRHSSALVSRPSLNGPTPTRPPFTKYEKPSPTFSSLQENKSEPLQDFISSRRVLIISSKRTFHRIQMTNGFILYCPQSPRLCS